MMKRPFFLRGYTQADFADTAGRTLPVVTEVTGVRVVSDEGARLDLHRVTPASDWLSDEALMLLHEDYASGGPMPQWRGQTVEERAKREAMRERCEQVREEFKTTWREWCLWGAALAIGIVGSYFAPTHWGYGWSLESIAEWIGRVWHG